MERLAVAFFFLATGLIVPGAFIFPAAIIGCGVVLCFYRAKFVFIIVRFLLIWVCFYTLVSAGRYFSGATFLTLVKDGSSGLGLALIVSFSGLLVITEQPRDVLKTLDRIKFPRELIYAILSLILLLPYIKTVGSRQLALLELKGIGRGRILDRFRAYVRVVGPLFSVLFTRQLAHARSLASRNFFKSRTFDSSTIVLINKRGILVIVLLLLNDILWFEIWHWNS